MRRGSAWTAVLGVNTEELQASIDGALTFGLLWLDHEREHCGKNFVESLALFVPAGTSAVVRARMAHLAPGMCKWRLFEVGERGGEMQEVDCSDMGNIETRLVRCADEAAARQRFNASIARVHALVPAAEIAIVTPGEIAFRLHGLEFARARMATSLPRLWRWSARRGRRMVMRCILCGARVRSAGWSRWWCGMSRR